MSKKTQTLPTLIEQKDFKAVMDKLFALGEGILGNVGNLSVQLFLNHFQDYDERLKFVTIMLNKIDTFENQENFIETRALCFEELGSNFILSGENIDEKKDVKFERYKNALSHLEEAIRLYQELLITVSADLARQTYNQKTQDISLLVRNTVTGYKNLEEGIKLAEISSAIRKENFGIDHPKTLQALLTLAELGTKSQISYETRVKCLNDAELAYNVICDRIISANNASQVKDLLNFMGAMYKELGDSEKAIELNKEASCISKEFKILDKSTKDIIDSRTLILKKGFTDIETLKIKSLIQEKVLNPIYVAAADGKWHNGYIGVEWGVVGYLQEDFLKQTLGKEFNDDTLKIALGLSFEAINLGIMNSSTKNPLVAAIFVKKYDAFTKDLLEVHPEYFVDKYIIQSSINSEKYNKFFEKMIMPVVETRIQEKVLKPVKDLLKSGDWSDKHAEKLVYLLSDEHLLENSLVKYSVLGNNLTQIPDILNIARIITFKVIIESIVEEKSVNYSPIQTFTAKYPCLNVRIADNHPEYYLNNKLISQLCNNGKNSYLATLVKETSCIDLSRSTVIFADDEIGGIKLSGEDSQVEQSEELFL
jgi:tetratricopeptide (TPR) repeat protein